MSRSASLELRGRGCWVATLARDPCVPQARMRPVGTNKEIWPCGPSSPGVLGWAATRTSALRRCSSASSALMSLRLGEWYGLPAARATRPTSRTRSFAVIGAWKIALQVCALNIFRRKMFGPPFAISRGVRCFAAISIHARGVWGRMFLCAHTPTLTTTHVCVCALLDF